MLLTNGCSFVWGDELPGAYDHPVATHQSLTFPHLLAERMNMEDYVNLAVPGAGNDLIFRNTMTYLAKSDKRKQPTHMVIIWTAWQRMELLKPEYREIDPTYKLLKFNGMVQFSPERVSNLQENIHGTLHKYYNDVYTHHVTILHDLGKMLAVQNICEARGIKLIQGVFHSQMYDNLKSSLKTGNKDYIDEIENHMRCLKPTSKLGMGHWTDMYSLSAFTYKDLMPRGHPGVKTHQGFAHLLHTIYRKMK